MKKIYSLLFSEFIRTSRVLPRSLRMRQLFLFGLIIILAGLEVASILSLSFLAMSVASPEQMMQNVLIQHIFSFSPIIKTLCTDTRYFTLLTAILVVVLMMLKNLMSLIVAKQTSRFGETASLYTGEVLLRQYLYNPYSWHLTSESVQVQQALQGRILLGNTIVLYMNIYTSALTSIALFFLLTSATPTLILGIVLAVGCFAYMLYRSLKQSIDAASMSTCQYAGEEMRIVQNAINGIREVLLYQQQKTFAAKFEDAIKKNRRGREFLLIAPNIPPWILELVGFSMIPASVWVLLRFYDAPLAEIAGALTLMILMMWRVLPLFNRSLSQLILVRSQHAQVDAILQQLEQLPTTILPEDIIPTENFVFSQQIALQQVSFLYPATQTPVFSDLSVTIRKGEKVGIVGSSGAGKSTLSCILSGLLTPSSGKLLLDGKELSTADLAAYRAMIGYVSQSPYILPGTLAENVTFSQWGKPYDAERVRHACTMAALDIVGKHPKGILLPLGEGGKGLSGGQIQRVAIARVLYAKPQIMLLDEASSALDQGTEAAIMETIYSLPEDITIVIIAHRLTTVRHCDTLFWIEDGRLRAQGSPNVILPQYEQYLASKKIYL